MRVLLTGGSGFIAAHCLETLLHHGHSVVTTVRSKEKGERILSAHPSMSSDKLSYVIVEDIAVPGAFDRAAQSKPPFEGVIHMASPFHFNIKDAKKDLLDPAVNGTNGILHAIKTHAPYVRRVVITSSFASMLNMKEHPTIYTEENWNPVTLEEAASNAGDGYRGSKTFAEKAAWKFVEDEKPNFTLATINPPLVFGPVVHYLNSLDAINTSNARFRDMISGHMQDKLAPTGTFYWVDVHDVALAHVRALERPDAAGDRFLVSGSRFTNGDIAKIIKAKFPEMRSRLPENCESDLPEQLYEIDNSKARKILGIVSSPLEQCVEDTLKSLLQVGA